MLADSWRKISPRILRPLGEPIALTELQPSELSLEPIRADSLILLQSASVILHVEFQTRPQPQMPFRMADYRLRAYRRYPDREMRQVVVYLTPSSSSLVYQNTFEILNLRHRFDVVRYKDQRGKEPILLSAL